MQLINYFLNKKRTVNLAAMKFSTEIGSEICSDYIAIRIEISNHCCDTDLYNIDREKKP